ncbi:MAG TPA: MFS transporter, partial [Agromyces sp.]|nr:MFS transporter [Agromyces sp.]
MTRRATMEPLFTRAFVALGLADLCYFTAAGVAIFGLPLYVTGPIGGNDAWAGVAFGVFALSALVLRPIAGRLSDTLGRRPLLLGGALIAAASLALLAVADHIAVIIALRLLAGVGEAAFFVAGFAAIADLAPRARLGEALSYNSLGLYLGIALGPPLGELLVTMSGYVLAWTGAAVLAVVAAGLALLVGETREPTPEGTVADRHFIHRPALPIALGFLASLIAMGGFLAFASIHAVDVGLPNASLALFTYGAVVVTCRIAFARVPDRLPPLALGAAALAVLGTGLVIAATWQTAIGLIVGAAVAAVGIAFTTPAFFSAIFATASPAQRGVASGTASAAIDLGLGLGPIALGFLASLIAMGGFLAFASIHAVDVGLPNASLALFTYGAVVVTCRIAFARV